MTASLTPTSDESIIQDPDLKIAVDRKLATLTGKARERGQAAAKRLHSSGIIGTFPQLVTAYFAAIDDAATRGGRDDAN